MTDLKTIQAHVGVPADGVLGPQTLSAIAKALGISGAQRSMREPAAFFAAVRQLTGGLTTTQVVTINSLLTAAAHWPIGWLAYGLATAWHEARLKPVEELGRGKGRAYAKPGARMKAVENPPLYGGQIPYGRGLVQLTWCDNYEWADVAAAEAGLIQPGDILNDFDLVMRSDIATFILVAGMEGGHFTGKGLGDYIGPRGTVQQFTQGRRIINGTDRAAAIASYAVLFQDAADAGSWS